MNYEDNPKSIKYYVKQFIVNNTSFFKNKVVVDFPAGNGVTSRILKEAGATPVPLDLFPDFFNIEGIECKYSNIIDKLEIEDNTADVLFCQEGIEHFSDQFGAYKEFNRVLKKGGSLVVTTPNYSSIRSKLSYFLSESERYNKMLAPNEIDSVWRSEQDKSDEFYLGHLFLVGVQKLRVLGALNGFKVKTIHPTMIKFSSAIMLPLFYPFIYLSNFRAYRSSLRRNKHTEENFKKEVYKEVFKMSVNPRVLVDSHLMIEYTKELELNEIGAKLNSDKPKIEHT